MARIAVVIDVHRRRGRALDFILRRFAQLTNGIRVPDRRWSGGCSFGGGGFFVIGEDEDAGPVLRAAAVRHTIERSVRYDIEALGEEQWRSLADAARTAGAPVSPKKLDSLPVKVEFTGAALEQIADAA